MPPAASLIAVITITAFLAGAATGAFILMIISIHRTGRGLLPEDRGNRRGAIARHILTRTRSSNQKTSE